MRPTTSRRCRWAAAAWAEWAEWTSRSAHSIRTMGRARGVRFGPFLILGHAGEHVLGLIQLSRLPRRGGWGPMVAAGGDENQSAQEESFHSGKVPLCPKAKKG